MLKKALKYFISVALAAVLLWFSFRGISWDEFLANLRNCSWGWVAAAMGAGVLAFFLRALRWKKLIDPIDPSISKRVSFNAINISYLANLVLPRVGEFVRCGFITKHSETDEDGHHKASYDKVLGTVVVERSWDVVTMLFLVIVTAMAMWNRFGSFFRDSILEPVAGRLNVGLGGIALISVAVVGLCIFLIWRFRHSSKVLQSVSKFIQGLWEGIASCLKMKRWWLFLVYTALIWTMYWLMSLFVLWSVQGMDIAGASAEMSQTVSRLAGLCAADALFLMLVGSISSLVPVPGGFGAFHYIVATALLSVYGIPFEIGIMFATLSHESQTITMLLCGGLSYADESVALIK